MNEDDKEKLRDAKRKLVEDFEVYNLDKLIQVLSLVDKLFVVVDIGNLDDVLEIINTLRETFFIINFNHFVNRTEEKCI